jgi:hypothetical protein
MPIIVILLLVVLAAFLIRKFVPGGLHGNAGLFLFVGLVFLVIFGDFLAWRMVRL